MLKRLAAPALVVLSLSLPCFAAPIYSNGTGNFAGNNPFSANGVFVAQDFSLLSDTTLGGLSYNAYTTGATLPVSAVNVKIYADAAGSVGAQLYSGSFAVASDAVTGSDGGYILKDFFVDLPGWDLSAGHYWLGLRVDPAQTDMHWTIPTSPALGYGSYIGNAAGDPGAYVNYGLEHSFTLFDAEGEPSQIPEPSTAALLFAGLTLAALRMRSRRE